MSRKGIEIDEVSLAMMREMEAFVTIQHERQFRKSSCLPYRYHLFDVTKKVGGYGIKDGYILAAALGHDLLEDTEVKSDRIKATFGDETLKLIEECTRPDSEGKGAENKIRWLLGFEEKSDESIIIKVADRVCNVTDYAEANNERYAAKYAAQAYSLYNRVRDWRQRLESGVPLPQFFKEIKYPQDIIKNIYKDVDKMTKLVERYFDVELEKAGFEEVLALQKKRG